jgi:hypothetical protein
MWALFTQDSCTVAAHNICMPNAPLACLCTTSYCRETPLEADSLLNVGTVIPDTLPEDVMTDLLLTQIVTAAFLQ